MEVPDSADLLGRIQKALDGFLADHEPKLRAMGEELAPMTEEVAQFLSGGKRLRPRFCFWGHLGAGGLDSDEIVQAAAALELFQACSTTHRLAVQRF